MQSEIVGRAKEKEKEKEFVKVIFIGSFVCTVNLTMSQIKLSLNLN